MPIQMQRQSLSPNGQQKHERNMETDTDKSSLWDQERNDAGGEMMKYEMIDLPETAIIGKVR